MRLFLALLILWPIPAHSAPDFQAWLSDIRKDARRAGISESVIKTALTDIEPVPRIIELDRKQPEGRLTFAQYKRRVISQARSDQGRRLLKKHRALLERVSQRYGVQPQYIVALWGIETSYGNNTGGFDVIEALATLAHDGRRSAFFRAELMEALKILDEGHISHDRMQGSWAGAMGQNQFMPSSFHRFAVDGNNDGRRDIWTSLPDVFASTAHYLSENGWRGDERWGRKVKVTRDIPSHLVGLEHKMSLTDWRKMGLTTMGGRPIPVVAGMQASFIQPDGTGGDKFLVYNNFRVLMTWNRSTYFASSVGLLADLIAMRVN